MFRYILSFLFICQSAFAGLPPTTAMDSADAKGLPTFFFQFPNFTGTHTGVTFSLGVNGIAGGGTNNSSVYSAGSLIFSNGTSLTQDNAHLYWDDLNYALGINGTPQAASEITTINSTAAAKPIWMFNYGAGSTGGLRSDFARGTSTSPAAAQSGDILNVLSGRGYGTSQFPSASTGNVQIYAGETFTNTSNATYVTIKTTPTGSVTNAERLRVNSTGNVLIGTTTDSGNTGNLLQVAGNASANNFLSGYTTTATSAGTTVLTVGSTYQQFWTGATTQTVTLPVVSTLGTTGFGFISVNNSTGIVTCQSSGANTVYAQPPNTTVLYVATAITGTTAASWSAQPLGGGGMILPTVSTALNTGTATGTGGFVSGTYTTPANVAWIEVWMVGGGGGGAQASGGTPQSGTAGGNTTFGTSLLIANGGAGATAGNADGGAGGTASVTTSSTVLQIAALQGGYGGGSSQNATASAAYLAGGDGGSNPLGGGGGAGAGNTSAQNGRPNTGAGGGGGGAANGVAQNSGPGGGAGGYVKAIIYPTAGQTFSYSVGSLGAGGNTGTGFAGGAGGLGAIYVIEYYNNGAIGTSTNVTGVVAIANGGTGQTSITGAINRIISSVSSATAAGAAANTDYVYLVSGTTTLTLPTAASNTNRYSIKNTGTNSVTVATTSSQTIDGTLTIVLPPGNSVDIISDTSNWRIF
jgi:hypothetical protein